MTRIFLALGASLIAFVSVSCCCSSDPKPPKLRPEPKFKEIQTPATPPAPVEVEYVK